MPSAVNTIIPVDGVPSVKQEFRAQFATIKTELEHGGFVTDPTTSAEATGSVALASIFGLIPTNQGTITTLSLTVSNPPTQAEVQAIADKIDEVILALRAAGVFLA